jgi:hypothetical protein
MEADALDPSAAADRARPAGASPAARTRTARLLAATPLVLLLTHYAAVLPHEFSHSVVAWVVGIKDQPGNVDWGGTSLLNVLGLVDIYENVDYRAALAAASTGRSPSPPSPGRASPTAASTCSRAGSSRRRRSPPGRRRPTPSSGSCS